MWFIERSQIKNLQGIISSPKENILLSDIDTSKDETEIIGYYVKQSLKEGFFPEDAWRLAKKAIVTDWHLNKNTQNILHGMRSHLANNAVK